MRFAFRFTLLCMLLATTVAHAEDRAGAREHYKRAMQHYKLSEFKPALDEFKEAFRLYEEPSMLFNIGQCYRQLDQRADAVRFYKSYLREVPNAQNRDEVVKMIAALDKQIADDDAKRKAAEPPPVVTPPTAIVAKPEKPLYKKWWLWTAVGGVVAVGLGVGLGVGLTVGRSSTPSAKTAGGTFEPFK